MSNKLYKIKNSLKQEKDPEIRERLLMIQAAYQEPLRDAAERFGCAHGKIDYWKKRYEVHGIHGLYTKQRSGRPPLITEQQNIRLRRIVRKHNTKHGWRTKNVRELVAKDTGVIYSVRHTIRIIQSWGMAKVKPRPRYAFSKQEDRKAFLKKPKSTWRASRQAGQ